MTDRVPFSEQCHAEWVDLFDIPQWCTLPRGHAEGLCVDQDTKMVRSSCEAWRKWIAPVDPVVLAH